MKQTVIILIPCDVVSDGRTVLETIENDTFNSKDELLIRICYEEDNPIDVENVIILSLTEYMDMCNDTDSDTKEEYRVDNFWTGYAQIQQEKKKEVKEERELKPFEITAEFKTYGKVTVMAYDEDDAIDRGSDTDGGDFTVNDKDSGDFSIIQAKEVKK